jgi:RecB family exonuclease
MATWISEPQAAPVAPPRITIYRHWERFHRDDLEAIRAKIALVLDDRDRQLDLFAPPAGRRGYAEGEAALFGGCQPSEESGQSAHPLLDHGLEVAVTSGTERDGGLVREIDDHHGSARGALDGQAPQVLDRNGKLVNQSAQNDSLYHEKNKSLAQVLSPSQMKTFLDCSARWWFKYGLGLPDQRGGSLVRGSSVHKVAEWAMRQKLAGNAWEMEDAAEIYEAAWDEQCEGASFAKDEDPEQLKLSGAILARKYLEDVAPEVAPRDIELKVTGEINGVPVQGYVDLIDTSGRIIDLKTAKAKPAGVDPGYAFQLATYHQLAPHVSGEARIDTLVATKVPQLVRMDYKVSVADQLLTTHLYPHVREGMREGLYFPSRCGNMCSRKYCAFADACCKEFGGTVE